MIEAPGVLLERMTTALYHRGPDDVHGWRPANYLLLLLYNPTGSHSFDPGKHLGLFTFLWRMLGLQQICNGSIQSGRRDQHHFIPTRPGADEGRLLPHRRLSLSSAGTGARRFRLHA